MTSSPDDKTAHLALPPERFYWALLDVSSLPKRARRYKRSLGFLFENALPLPIEDVQARYRLMSAQGSQQVLACGLAKDSLRATINASPEALTLAPRSLPTQLAGAGVDEFDSADFNLLIGEFEPAQVRRATRRFVVHTALLTLVLATVVAIGLERRAMALRQDIAQAQDAKRQAISQVIQPSSSPTAQPLDLRMLAELRTLRQTRSVPGGVAGPAVTDATDTLAMLMTSWPRSLLIQTESISITPTTMTLRAQAPSSADVQSLTNALADLDGWQIQQPQISATGAAPPDDGVNATLQWKRSTLEGGQR